VSLLRPDLAVIAANVAPGSRVLDIGCGDGTLMQALRDDKRCDARGMELDPADVGLCVAKGLSVIQGDADRDLAFYPDRSVDYAILSQTLQTTMRPDLVLEQLLRIGRRAFVSFPNFAHWRVRLSLLWRGRMPVTRLLPTRRIEGGHQQAPHETPEEILDRRFARGEVDLETYQAQRAALKSARGEH